MQIMHLSTQLLENLGQSSQSMQGLTPQEVKS